MSKIITLTFNPVIDKSSSIDRIVPEKKLRCSTPKFGPGGGGINVSRALKNMGKDSTAIFPAGGHSGNFLKELIAGEGISFLFTETAAITRENFIVLDTSCNQQYRFGFPGEPVTAQETEDLLAKLEGAEADFIVASGSLLPGMPEEILARVARLAKKKEAKLIVDTSGKALQASLDDGVFLLKPNLGELSSLVGKEEVGNEELDEIARDIIGKGQCEIIVVSMGAQGARLITNKESYHARVPLVKRVSTLGAGDSMVAGMVLGLSQGKPMEEVLRLGVACGTAATLTHGSELCRKEDVERLLKQIVVTSI
jgi:6-phosphofructokinase 2